MNKITFEDLQKLDINSLNHPGINDNDKITCINGIFVKVDDCKKLLKRKKKK